jgi:ABC-type phosphate transport system auxiliary subunit
MDPQELSTYLKSMASYIEEAKTPSRRAIVAGIQRAVQELQAGRVTKFVDKDYAQAMHGLEALIERLTKAANTLNPQNEAKSQLEHTVGDLQKLKAGLSEQFQSLAQVEI